MQKFIIVLLVCVFGVFLGYHTHKSMSIANDVFLENVEALASMEGSEGDILVKCLMQGDSKCPAGGIKVKYVIEGLSVGDDEENY